MPSREEGTGGWRAEAEVTPASGGHLAPDVHATEPVLDPMRPSESRSAARAAPRADRRAAATRRRGVLRRVKRTVRHIDPVSVLKISLFFYACFLVVWLIFVAILYGIVASMGVFDAIEDFSRSFALEWKVEITLWWVERWAFLIGLIFGLFASLVNLILAFIYNVAADMIGGISMTFVEKD